MEGKHSDLTILMFPFIAHGHISPFLELAKNLCKKNFNVFFCSTAINLSSIRENLEKSSPGGLIQLVELHLPSFPELPPEYHTSKNLPPNLILKLFQAFNMSSSDFDGIITSLKPDMLIYDAFQPWAARQALSLGIPAVHFATLGAAAYSFFYHISTFPDLAFPFEAIYLRDHERKPLQPVLSLGFDHFELSCDIVLMKTCKGIEGKYTDFLSEQCKKRFVPVGSLIAQADNDQEDHPEIMEWLSEKKPFSTVFIAFGSENYLSKDQMEEIAKGLEICNVNFIWAVRFPDGQSVRIEEALPKGFLDTVKDRGMILQGWAPQVKILAHRSIGAFVSHCGLSSTLESINFRVPIIAIPLRLDQPLNARLVVEAGVGVEVTRDEDGHFSGEDVAKAINTAVLEKTGEEMRRTCAELSNIMEHEQEDAINETAEQLRRICVEHKLQK